MAAHQRGLAAAARAEQPGHRRPPIVELEVLEDGRARRARRTGRGPPPRFSSCVELCASAGRANKAPLGQNRHFSGVAMAEMRWVSPDIRGNRSRRPHPECSRANSSDSARSASRSLAGRALAGVDLDDDLAGEPTAARCSRNSAARYRAAARAPGARPWPSRCRRSGGCAAAGRPSRSAISIGVGPRDRARARGRWWCWRSPRSDGSQPGQVHLHAARDARHGIHVLDREGDAGATPRAPRCPSTKSRGVVASASGTAGARRPRRRRPRAAISAERSSLPHGSVPQTRWVNSRHGAWTAQHRDLVVLGQLLDRRRLLAQRVDADHHLDRVVAQRRGVARRRARSTRGRPRPSTGRSAAGRASGRRRPGAEIWSSRSQDHALAQRPRADLSSAQAEEVHARLGDERARHDLVGPARRDAGQSASSSASSRSASGSTRAARRARARGGTSGPSPDGAAPQIRASERNVFEVAAAWSGAPARSSRRRRGRCRRGSACAAARTSSLAGRPLGEELPGQPGRARAAATRRRRAPRRRRRRSPASRRRCRRPPAGPADQPNQRRTARKVSRASSSPESTSSSTPVALARRGEHVVGVGGVADRRGREAEHVLAALVLGDPQGARDEAASASIPRSVTAPSSSRCSASRSGSL